ncbi:methyltransferase domain-containing protein [Micromonospora olivasterospora]|uniref:Methylation protein EvaC n=1 Tax=Micromonospora olivasterospora TaxID=1880 RepID=A0A562I256_MICOL|nr:class I SAM-dependent methyltransferase [Micromonospora olivasterospora]TWH65121.1 methylation protein EvaC [Micromonospora olivasterospora]
MDCRICGGTVTEFLDLGRQPSANRFVPPGRAAEEPLFPLAVGACGGCTMVQLTTEVPRELKYHDEYPYRASGSALHREHFARAARDLLRTELTGPDPFVVEVGCNDGVMLGTIADAGVRHLGVDPAAEVAALAAARGVRVLTDWFEARTAAAVRAVHGPADVVFGANTICHLPYLGSVLAGVDTLLTADGVFVFEEPYLGTIVERTAFDQIYDEHVFYFTVRSVRELARRFGFELVDVAPTPLHGGELRYTLARPGRRRPSPAVEQWLDRERATGLAHPRTVERFAEAVRRVRTDLVATLERLAAEGRRVVGYGAPGKSTTVTNYCGIGPALLPFICDSTPAKQGRVVPGARIPIAPPEAFRAPYPDFALLFAWNHAEEIMAKERDFAERGGRWIVYVPRVQVL